MKILIGSDHGGYKLKEAIKKALDENEIEYEDYGTMTEESIDYPEIAKKVAQDVKDNLGILVCGTGLGMSMAANKVKGIRAALCHDEYTAQMAREHNDANVLCLGGRVLSEEEGIVITKKFIETPFSGEERHQRRIDKIE